MKRLTYWLSLLACVSLAGSVHAQDTHPKAGAKFQALSVIEEIPADHVGKVMNIMSEALGVSCTHCHAGYDFAKEGVANKDKAREMLVMTLRINREQYNGRTVVSCVTCHQGHATPPDASQSATALSATVKTPFAFQPAATAVEPKPNADVDETFRRLRQQNTVESSASGGLMRLSAKRIEPSGKEEQEEIVIAAPDSWRLSTDYSGHIVKEIVNAGTVEKWSGSNKLDLKPDEAVQIKIEATLMLGGALQNLFPKWSVSAPSLKITRCLCSKPKRQR